MVQNQYKGVLKMDRKIHCDVSECVYHDGECTCTADCIKVDCTAPSDTCDAKCSTYKYRE